VDALAELNAVGCAFVSLRDNLDLTTPAGRMMFHVIGAMAEFERELIRERVKAGLAHARSKGQKLGRPKIRRDRDGDAKVIRRMRAEGDDRLCEDLLGSRRRLADIRASCKPGRCRTSCGPAPPRSPHSCNSHNVAFRCPEPLGNETPQSCISQFDQGVA